MHACMHGSAIALQIRFSVAGPRFRSREVLPTRLGTCMSVFTGWLALPLLLLPAFAIFTYVRICIHILLIPRKRLLSNCQF